MRLKCKRCGYEWESRSKLRYVKCPRCYTSVANPESPWAPRRAPQQPTPAPTPRQTPPQQPQAAQAAAAQPQGQQVQAGGKEEPMFVFKCPQCGEEMRGSVLEPLADAASSHIFRMHGVLLSPEKAVRYIKRVR